MLSATAEGLLSDPTNRMVMLHLLYSGPRTNKGIAEDFSVMRMKTKTGVLIRGRSGYHYIRSATNRLEKSGVLKEAGPAKEKMYEFNVDCGSGLLKDMIFSVMDFRGMDYIHSDIEFTEEHMNRILGNPIFRAAAGPGLAKAFELSDYDCRLFIYNYKKRIENSLGDIALAVLGFLADAMARITEVETEHLWSTIYNGGAEPLRASLNRDFNSYNWRSLPESMTKDIDRAELETYIEEYRGSVPERVLDSVLGFWRVKTGQKDVLELVAYSYLIQRLLVYLIYCYLMSRDMDWLRAVGRPRKAIEAGDDAKEIVISAGERPVRDALKRLNRDIRGKYLAESQKTLIFFDSSLYLEKEFIELVRMRYKEDAEAEEKRSAKYTEALGRKPTGLSISSALEIANKKGLARTVRTADIVQLCVRLYGIRSLRGMRKLVAGLSEAGYAEYFGRIREMYGFRCEEPGKDKVTTQE